MTKKKPPVVTRRPNAPAPLEVPDGTAPRSNGGTEQTHAGRRGADVMSVLQRNYMDFQYLTGATQPQNAAADYPRPPLRDEENHRSCSSAVRNGL